MINILHGIIHNQNYHQMQKSLNILFLDVYKKSWSRISKDTAGGYGTENDLGDSFFGRLISFIIKKFIFWPNLSFAQLMQELKSYGHKVLYKKHTGLYNYKGNWDVIFLCGSIVCFETEIANIINIIKKKKYQFFTVVHFQNIV